MRFRPEGCHSTIIAHIVYLRIFLVSMPVRVHVRYFIQQMTFTDQKQAFALFGLPPVLTQRQPLQRDSPTLDHHRPWVTQITLVNPALDYSCGGARIHPLPSSCSLPKTNAGKEARAAHEQLPKTDQLIADKTGCSNYIQSSARSYQKKWKNCINLFDNC